MNQRESDLPIEERRTRRFIRRELWFVVAAVVALILVAWFASHHATRRPTTGRPLGELSSEPTSAPAPARPPN